LPCHLRAVTEGQESKKAELRRKKSLPHAIAKPFAILNASSTGHDVLLFGRFGFEEVDNRSVIVGAVFRSGIKTNPLLF
jgi:hypothetical protein